MQDLYQPHKSLRILYITIQIITLYFYANDLFKFVIDPMLLILRDTILCDIAAYTTKFLPPVYYSVYLFQVLLRLELSFRGSHLALSRRAIVILFFFLSIMAIGFPISMIFTMQPSCIWTWTQNSMFEIHNHQEHTHNSLCASPNTGPMQFVTGAFAFSILGLNILFGMIFGMKLKQTLSMNTMDDAQGRRSVCTGSAHDFKLKSLIIKNSILTFIGSLSTLINYAIFMASTQLTGGNGIFIYLDVYINTLVIGLMFQYNEKYYKKCCKCCIVLCLRDLDNGYNKSNKKDTKRRSQLIDKYLENSYLPSLRDITTTSISRSSPLPHHHDQSKLRVMSISNIATNSNLTVTKTNTNIINFTPDDSVHVGDIGDIGEIPCTPYKLSADSSMAPKLQLTDQITEYDPVKEDVDKHEAQENVTIQEKETELAKFDDDMVNVNYALVDLKNGNDEERRDTEIMEDVLDEVLSDDSDHDDTEGNEDVMR